MTAKRFGVWSTDRICGLTRATRKFFQSLSILNSCTGTDLRRAFELTTCNTGLFPTPIGAADPATKRLCPHWLSLGQLLFRLVDKRISSTEVIEFLAQMLRHHGSRHLVVVMDRAPPHTSKKTCDWIKSQENLHIFHLPKYSPDWNPDEKVWNHLKHQELASHQAKNKAELKQLARRKLQSMAKRPSLMRGIFYRCCVAELFDA